MFHVKLLAIYKLFCRIMFHVKPFVEGRELHTKNVSRETHIAMAF